MTESEKTAQWTAIQIQFENYWQTKVYPLIPEALREPTEENSEAAKDHIHIIKTIGKVCFEAGCAAGAGNVWAEIAKK